METTHKMITVGRPINGISINCDEFLLDGDNNLLEFCDKHAAYTYLRKNGVDLTDAQMEESFNFYLDGKL